MMMFLMRTSNLDTIKKESLWETWKKKSLKMKRLRKITFLTSQRVWSLEDERFKKNKGLHEQVDEKVINNITLLENFSNNK